MNISEKYDLLISSISHEIRNPVTLISSYLQLLESSYPEIKDNNYWQVISEEMDYLKSLLTDLSSFNNAGKLHTVPVDFSCWLPDYIHHAKQLILELPSPLQHAIHFSTPDDFTDLPVLCVDPVKLRQILDNLIRNAVEAHTYSSCAAPYIQLSCYQKTHSLCISVSDNGCGISKEDLSGIFEPFISHKTGGSGLGLAICQRIIKAHHGRITVQSEPDKGSIFTISLPVVDDPNR